MASDLISLSSPRTQVHSLQTFRMRPVKTDKTPVRYACEAATRATLRDPYLVSTQEKSPKSREELLKVLRIDRRAFYFHKRRHLFKRYVRMEQPSSPLPKKSSHSLTPKIRTHPESPPSKLPMTRTLTHRRPSIRSLVRMCDLEQLSYHSDKRRQQSALRDFSQELHWTQHILDQAVMYGPKEIVPVLQSEIEAEEGFRQDINRFTEDYHRIHRDPFQEAAKFAFMLRMHKNTLI